MRTSTVRFHGLSCAALARLLNATSAMLRAAERPLAMLLSRHIGRRRLVPLARCLHPERGGAGEEALGVEIGRDLNEEIAAPCALPAGGARGLEGLDHGARCGGSTGYRKAEEAMNHLTASSRLSGRMARWAIYLWIRGPQATHACSWAWCKPRARRRRIKVEAADEWRESSIAHAIAPTPWPHAPPR